MSTTDKLTDSERDTIIAALRFWQEKGSVDVCSQGILEIAEDHGPALDDDAIDTLCERINTAADVVLS
jgi:hypothetical protein